MNTSLKSLRSLLLAGAALLMASVAQTHAAVVYSDDFLTNPFASRWSSANTASPSYDLMWTGNPAYNPNSWDAKLPVNANAHSI